MKCKLATVSMNVTYDIKINIQKYFQYMEEAHAEGADLIVFPEQSLQGYIPSLKEISSESVNYQYEHAESVPGGDNLEQVITKAKEYGMHVILGMTEIEGDKLYNTMVLIGPQGYIGKYRKVHQPGIEGEIYTCGNEFPVFDTSLGKIGMLICFDKVFPEMSRILTLKGAQILVMSTAWGLSLSPERWKEDPKLRAYMLYDCVRAMENQCFFISSDQFGKCGDLFYPGHSNIVAPTGIPIASTGFAEGIVYAEVDVEHDIQNAKESYYDLQKRRHPEVYRKEIE